MHQQAPALAPHSNDAPQRAQARRCSGNAESVRARLILALSGVMAGEINHAAVTVLRRQNYCVVQLSWHFLP
jgi:hypothetical protein